jgi:pimeloyl-ACP methyl ester carboxylesterase
MSLQPEPISEAEPWWRIGIAPDEARQPAEAILHQDGYTRIIIEFDDQGCVYEASQMQTLISTLDRLKGQRAIIVVFVHGWKHNARAEDPNLASFQKVLAQTARAEQLAQGTEKRPVLGVFVGWRGLSFYAGWLTNLTFWNRKTAALRVALGSVRELFGRLRDYRRQQNNEPVLVIVGHSFGGLVVYSALAQSLIEAAALDQDVTTNPSFADLVLLVNPAFEAARYLPIHSLVKTRQFAKDQPPIFISITSNNDDATGLAFPVGAWLGSRWEHTRTDEERAAIVHTMGHLEWMRTHEVTADPAAGPAPATRFTAGAAFNSTDAVLLSERAPSDESYKERSAGWVRHFAGGAVLRHTAMDPNNPFWVVQATKQVIDGHNGIFGDVFLGFIRKLVAEQLR